MWNKSNVIPLKINNFIKEIIKFLQNFLNEVIE